MRRGGPQRHGEPVMPPVGGWNTGVYAITHRVSGKSYVGGAYKSFGLRFWIHRRDLRAGRHGNQHLQNAWNKYGASSFSFRILERCSPESCKDREQYWIIQLDATNRKHGYNKSPTAGSPLGTKHPPEYGKAVSERNRNRGSEILAKIGAASRGRIPSEGTRKKLSEAQKRLWMNPEVRGRRVSSNLGKKRSEETRFRIAASLKGRRLSPEHRAKCGNGNRGRKQSLEEIRRRVESFKLSQMSKKGIQNAGSN